MRSQRIDEKTTKELFSHSGDRPSPVVTQEIMKNALSELREFVLFFLSSKCLISRQMRRIGIFTFQTYSSRRSWGRVPALPFT